MASEKRSPRPDAETAAISDGSGTREDVRGFAAGSAGADAKAAQIIGPYKLLELLGIGGFGEVWLAERREPMVQRVALKIIKPGMDSRAVIARFEQERQALAVMDHPNVAKVFDAGTTPPAIGSRPYFVMEHVAGEPITAYCDRHNLTIHERLTLFLPVCEAVQHAHHKGIIHRDLKPSNILVSVRDGSPVPKVIDFGVAKAVTHTFTQATVFTEQGLLIGTPEYMSPEQAEMGAADVDTRTDVYSLGVLLYELLSGLLPFDSASLRTAGYEAIRRIIREQEAVRPSTKLSTADDATAAQIAGHRQAQREHLARQLRRELDWIPIKALRKDRTERYNSPADLSRDIRNYLEGRALEAGPQSAAYRFRKVVRRNRGPVAGAAAVAGVLVLGLAGFAWQARRVSLERDAAEVERDRAKAVTAFVVKSLRSQDPNQDGREDMTVAAAMEQAIRGIENGELRERPATEALLLRTIATILNGTGRSGEAEQMAERALDTERRLHAGDHPDVAESLRILADVLDSLGRETEAEPLYLRTLEMYQRLHSGDDPDVAEGLANLALARQKLGNLTAAESLSGEALQMRRRLHQGDHPEVANSLNNLAFLLQGLGRESDAEPLFTEALQMRQRLYRGDHPTVAKSLNNLATARLKLGHLDEAEPLLTKSLEMSQRLFSGDNETLAVGLNNLGYVRQALRRPTQAEPVYRQSLAMWQRLYPGDHADVANTMKNLAVCLAAEGKMAEAGDLAQRALDMAGHLGIEGESLRSSCENALTEIRKESQSGTRPQDPEKPVARPPHGG